MDGYIYITGERADPGVGNTLTDPIFSPTPTLGACMPNIRKSIKIGDYIFVVSSKNPGIPQYVVGGFRVSEKISALAAYDRFPEYRLIEQDGLVLGNIITDADGTQSELDHHNNFSKRIENYIVGNHPIEIKSPKEVALCRKGTLPLLRKIFKKPGKSPIKVMGRTRRLEFDQVDAIVSFLNKIKKGCK